MGETSYKHTQPESSIERTDNEYLETQSARSAFNYDPNIDYVRQRAITIESMSRTCSKCFAKKWSYESNGMCCAGGKVILLDIEEPPQPLNSLLTSNHTYSKYFLNNIRKYNTLFQMHRSVTKKFAKKTLCLLLRYRVRFII